MSMDDDKIRALPCWNGAIDVAPLHGGLSNTNYLVTDANGKHVVRFGKDYPFHHVSREREVMVARAADEAGFAPRLEYASSGVMVTQFLDAKTFSAEDVRNNAGRIAHLLKDFHTQMPARISGAGFMFWAFHVIRDYASTLRTNHSFYADLLPEMLQHSEAFELAQVPLPIMFGHHDLLPANFLDDGKKLWLIDFEYAGFGTAMFDLAGVASNAQMTEGQSNALLETYFGHAPNAALGQSFAAMHCAALLRETLWAMVSAIFMNAPGANYKAYIADNLELYLASANHYQSIYGTLAK
jgi:thiamine kinase-like enzyme